MIAKITTGGDFAGAVDYILDPKKAAELLMGEGVRLKNTNSITKSFAAQTELNSRVSKAVGHISLDFSVQGKAKLNNEFLLKIADDYLNKMGIVNTQFIIARHYDKEHPIFTLFLTGQTSLGKRFPIKTIVTVVKRSVKSLHGKMTCILPKEKKM